MTCTPLNNNIFTHILKNSYAGPPGFDFDNLSVDPEITDENIASRSNDFVNYFKDM